MMGGMIVSGGIKFYADLTNSGIAEKLTHYDITTIAIGACIGCFVGSKIHDYKLRDYYKDTKKNP